MNQRTELQRENRNLRRDVARAEQLLDNHESVVDAKNAQLIFMGAPVETITETIEETLLQTADARADPRVREEFFRIFGRPLII